MRHVDIVFFQKFNLNLHKAIHGDRKLFKCQTCEKSFRIEYHLKIHERTHVVSSVYFECEACENKLKTAAILRAHQRLHVSTKTYQCKFCKKTFSQSGNMKIHERRHTKIKD